MKGCYSAGEHWAASVGCCVSSALAECAFELFHGCRACRSSVWFGASGTHVAAVLAFPCEVSKSLAFQASFGVGEGFVRLEGFVLDDDSVLRMWFAAPGELNENIACATF